MPDPTIINLWPDGSPNNPPDAALRPRLEVYRPETPLASPCPAVVVLPGGGYSGLAPHEAEPFARYFAAHGYVGIICRYRVAPHRFPAPMADAARGMRLVRGRAAEWGIDAGRVALIGFSAGGHLACTTATQPDLHHDPEDDLVGRYSPRPDRLILAYPVVSMLDGLCAQNLLGPDAPREAWSQMSNQLHVTPANPPAFIFHTANDPVVPVQHSLGFAEACLAQGVSVELHVYRSGPHGVGLASGDPKLASWMPLLLDWLA
ncbi:MAG: alpha/beta hydrolase [Anaerolineae bacterium]